MAAKSQAHLLAVEDSIGRETLPVSMDQSSWKNCTRSCLSLNPPLNYHEWVGKESGLPGLTMPHLHDEPCKRQHGNIVIERFSRIKGVGETKIFVNQVEVLRLLWRDEYAEHDGNMSVQLDSSLDFFSVNCNQKDSD